MKTPIRIFVRTVLICLVFSATDMKSQLNIVATTFSEMIVNPEMMNRPIVSVGDEAIQHITIEAILTDTETSEVIIQTMSRPIPVKQGINNITPNSSFFTNVVYGSSKVSGYIKTQRRLPSGRFEYCIAIASSDGEYYEDERCEELEIIVNEYLHLVYPDNGDTIDTPLPVLNWTTSSIQEKELGKKRYRMLISEILEDQTPELALNSNPSIFVEENLKDFSVAYPVSAKKLEKNQSYAWRVECLVENQVVDETETWMFTIRGEKEEESLKYATLKKSLGGNAYDVIDGKIYFAFDEPYAGQTEFPKCIIRSESGVEVPDPIEFDAEPEKNDESEESATSTEESKGTSEEGTTTEGANNSSAHATVQGSNKYLLDITRYQLKPGMYSLEVWNFKGEMRKLKFRIEK